MAVERGNGRRISIVVPRSRTVMHTVADQHHWGANAWKNRARGLLAIWREEEIVYVAGFLLKDIRNLKGKVDVFCFVYRASTATSML